MGSHDAYGKRILREAAGSAYQERGAPVEVDYKAGRPGHIDGAVGDLIAVEVESRVAKQIRGAVLDLIFHPYPRKLLVLVPVHMANVAIAAKQCAFALGRFIDKADFRVAVLKGTGQLPQLRNDADVISRALAELGWKPQSAAVNKTHVLDDDFGEDPAERGRRIYRRGGDPHPHQ